MGVLQVRLLCKWIPYVQLVCYLWDRDWKRKLLFPLFGPYYMDLEEITPAWKKGQQLWQIIFPFLVHALFLGHPCLLLAQECTFLKSLYLYLLNRKINAWWPLKIESPKKARPALKTIITLLTSERSGAVIHVIRVERALTGSNALFWAGSNGFML